MMKRPDRWGRTARERFERIFGAICFSVGVAFLVIDLHMLKSVARSGDSQTVGIYTTLQIALFATVMLCAAGLWMLLHTDE